MSNGLPPVIDPDSITETLCDGQFAGIVTGNLATLTFTHARPDTASLFAGGQIGFNAVVRARIVLTMPNLIALRDYLAVLIQAVETTNSPAPAAAGAPTKH